jgi:2-dehydropantoate 2-reductase
VRIAVMGTGGIGGFFGARLARSGEAVAFVARGEHLRAIQAGGLRIRSVEGDFTIEAPATDRPAQVPALIGPVDLVLVCVKLYDTEAAAEALRPLMGPDTAVLSLQNGVAKEDVLARVLGAERVMGGLSSAFVAIEAPGVIRHAHGGSIVFGERDGRASERAAGFLAAGRKAGIRMELTADIRRAQWEKYLMILGLSGLSALTRRPIGEIRGCPESRQLYRTVFEEVAAVARAEGVDLGDDVVARTMATGDALQPDSYSSMYHDVTHGRRLELDWLHGHAIRLAAGHAIPTPALFALYAGLRPAALAAERTG